MLLDPPSPRRGDTRNTTHNFRLLRSKLRRNVSTPPPPSTTRAASPVPEPVLDADHASCASSAAELAIYVLWAGFFYPTVWTEPPAPGSG